MSGLEYPASRRTFLKSVGVATAAAGLTACQNPERILPLLVPDAREEAGRPQFFATVCRECPAGCGIVARVNTARTTKVEGNPDHPVNRGKLCLRGQTAVQGLYNPDRLKSPLLRVATGKGSSQLRPTDWPTALAAFSRAVAAAAPGRARWLGRLETGTMASTIAAWLAQHQQPAPIYYEYFSYDTVRRGFALTHGAHVVPRLHLERAKYLLSFGAEFLETHVSNVQYAGDFAAMHSFGHTATPARFAAVAPRLSLTAANADEWWAARPGSEAGLAWALLGEVERRLGRQAVVPIGIVPPGSTLAAAAAAAGVAPAVVALAAERLAAAHRAGEPTLVLGPGYSTDGPNALSCQVAVNLLNDLLGNTGVTVDPRSPHALSQVATLPQTMALAAACARGEVDLLLLHHANPVYDFPRLRPQFAQAHSKVSFATWMDETTQDCDLVLPDTHFLEAWGDYAPWPAEATGMLQPTRLPVVEARPTGDILLGGEGRFASALEAAWTGRLPHGATWLGLLQKGVHLGTVQPQSEAAAGGAKAAIGGREAAIGGRTAAAAAPLGEDEFFLQVFPTVHLFDGRQANRTWAQEVASPLSKVAWDPWCELNPATAKRLGIAPNDLVRLDTTQGTAEFSVVVTTWIRPDCVGVVLGQGHSNFGMFANGNGQSPHLLQGIGLSPDGLWHPQGLRVKVQRLEQQRALANLQTVRQQWDKKVALAVELSEAQTVLAREPLGTESFYHFHQPYDKHRWGMVIDLSSCIGCNACQAACYAENNLAVWGRTGCQTHREMTWIRVELYEGDQEHPSTALNPDLRFIPMPCMHCGNAPCEYVCPVFAAYHTDEGLNGQVYNRCIGTRYCSNNCIYKVRRFNWYTPQWPEPLNQQLNPQVTVRAKGIMEKCTYCVQRIEQVELDARTNGTAIRDGDIQTACQQTCPTSAIVFGDFVDPKSEVSRLAGLNRSYGMFAEENTYPATHYLKKTKFELNRGTGARAPYPPKP